MGKIDVKKLKRALTLAHYDMIIQRLGIPIFSKSNSEYFITISLLLNSTIYALDIIISEMLSLKNDSSI